MVPTLAAQTQLRGASRWLLSTVHWYVISGSRDSVVSVMSPIAWWPTVTISTGPPQMSQGSIAKSGSLIVGA